ncbi:hypothetical protein WG947_05035 [Pontibacter sp. H259]|uniref:hypothetical protein n=1 Tax=Pontibacter sp. H259 TaxID=3133421 RepID=UPI0030BD0420
MRAFLILLVLLSITFGAYAQAIPSDKINYRAWIYLRNNKQVQKGMLLETSDSAVHFIDKSLLKRGYLVNPPLPAVIPVSSIERIKLRRKHSLTTGALLGALGGVITGAVIGYASGDDECDPATWCIFVYTAEEKATFGAILGVIPGTGLGLLLGSKRETIYIRGDQNQYNSQRNGLQKYTLTGK